MVINGAAHGILTLLVCGLLSACGSDGAGGNPVVEPPPAGNGVEGIYMGLRVNKIDNTVWPDYYTFLADGRAFRWVPQEGLGVPLDWTEACRGTECGTFTVAGNRVTFNVSSVGTVQVFERDAEGALRRPDEVLAYRRMSILDDVRLNATYGHVVSGDTVMALTLRPDGRFQERGTAKFLTSDNMAGRPAKGTGTYTISKSTLSLSYDGGPVVRWLMAVPPGVSVSDRPSSVQLRNSLIDRLP